MRKIVIKDLNEILLKSSKLRKENSSRSFRNEWLPNNENGLRLWSICDDEILETNVLVPLLKDIDIFNVII